MGLLPRILLRLLRNNRLGRLPPKPRLPHPRRRRIPLRSILPKTSLRLPTSYHRNRQVCQEENYRSLVQSLHLAR